MRARSPRKQAFVEIRFVLQKGEYGAAHDGGDGDRGGREGGVDRDDDAQVNLRRW